MPIQAIKKEPSACTNSSSPCANLCRTAQLPGTYFSVYSWIVVQKVFVNGELVVQLLDICSNGFYYQELVSQFLDSSSGYPTLG